MNLSAETIKQNWETYRSKVMNYSQQEKTHSTKCMMSLKTEWH